jgi:hypothetical protein
LLRPSAKYLKAHRFTHTLILKNTEGVCHRAGFHGGFLPEGGGKGGREGLIGPAPFLEKEGGGGRKMRYVIYFLYICNLICANNAV